MIEEYVSYVASILLSHTYLKADTFGNDPRKFCASDPGLSLYSVGNIHITAHVYETIHEPFMKPFSSIVWKAHK